MTGRVDSDVAVVRPWVKHRQKASAALDRLQARLEETEKACQEAWAWVDDALKALGAKTVFDIKDKRLSLPKAVAERDEARADAKRLRAEADRQLGRHLCYTDAYARERFWREVDAALAAHTPHLTSERPPTGTTYVTEEPDGDG